MLVSSVKIQPQAIEEMAQHCNPVHLEAWPGACINCRHVRVSLSSICQQVGKASSATQLAECSHSFFLGQD